MDESKGQFKVPGLPLSRKKSHPSPAPSTDLDPAPDDPPTSADPPPSSQPPVNPPTSADPPSSSPPPDNPPTSADPPSSSPPPDNPPTSADPPPSSQPPDNPPTSADPPPSSHPPDNPPTSTEADQTVSDTVSTSTPVTANTADDESGDTQQVASNEKSKSQRNETETKREQKSSSEKQTHQQSFPPLPYTVPHWSATPTESFFMSVIKNGTVIDEVSLAQKPYIVFGRLPCCDVQLEHPSLSRYHAVLQYRPHIETSTETEPSRNQTLTGNPQESGYYVYDLGSTHGTYINKTQINPRCYYRLRIGQMVKFGGSSRMFLLESGAGSQEDVEASAQEEIREILERNEELERKRAESKALREREARERESMGVMWGMVMDEVPEGEEEDIEIDPEKEAYYIDDPKKALRKFFDREGLEFEYETEEDGPPRARVFTAKIRLPIDTASGESVYAEASVQGKKKEAVLQCALNACRTLDANDMLRESSQKRQKRKRNWEENDYYDSDEDTFLDRTGSIEVKRKQRMKKAGVAEDTVATFNSLQDQLKTIQREMSQIEHKLTRNRQVSEGEGEDDLDQFMRNVGHQLDPSQKRELKQKLQSLKKEEERVSKLIAIARPAEMPARLDSDTLPSPGRPEPPKVSKPPTIKPHPKKARVVKQRSQERPSVPKSITVESEEQPKPMVTVDRKETKGLKSVESSSEEGGKRRLSAEEEQWQKDGDYCDWLPPEHQSGDGRTHLNDKYGY